MASPVALTRPISPRFDRCELTHLERQTIDIERARAQHAAYEEALVRAGWQVTRLPERADLPDSVFVEDAAVVVDEAAVVTRPGAASRRAEVGDVEVAVAGFRPIRRIEPPGTLDGGDVLCVGRSVFVGRSTRTNEEGIAQLRALLGEYGYTVAAVEFSGCLHLKTAVTRIGEGALLIQPAWVDPGVFRGFERVAVDPQEPWAANALWLGDAGVIFPEGFPATADRLGARGLEVHPVDVSEIAKAEGGVTCCSILLNTHT